MPIVNKSVSIAANATEDNLLSGSQFEFLPYNATLSFGLIQATGNVGDLLFTVISGADILQEESPVIVRNGMPVNPDDFVLNDVAPGGDRVQVKVRNTSAGAIVANVSVIIDPM